MFQNLFQNAKARLEKMDENGVQVRDIPLIATLLFIAAVVIVGELACIIWFFVILIKAFFNVLILLQLLPCLGIASFLTAIIVSFYMWVEENW